MKPIHIISQWLSVCLCFFTQAVFAQVGRAPAYPLITHNTYFSIWSITDTLNASTTRHWNNPKQPITGLIKVDDKIYSFLGQTAAFGQQATILSAADERPWSCPYTFTTPAANWNSVDFDDSAWTVGDAAFGNVTNRGTLWNTADIWLRRTFTLNTANTHKLLLRLYHDDNIEVYLNGVQVLKRTGWNDIYENFEIANHLVKGKNVIAIHCRNTIGGQVIDFGLLDAEAPSPGYAPINRAYQNSVNVTPTRTMYNFTCGNVNLDLSFISPLLLDDLQLLSRPVSYLNYKVRSTDGKPHDVQVYLGVSGDLAKNADQTLTAEQYDHKGLSIIKAGSTDQPMYVNTPERAGWGYLYVAVPKSYGAKQLISYPLSLNPFSVSDASAQTMLAKQMLLNTVIPFGKVSSTAVERHVEIAYDDPYPMQYFNQNLKPYWSDEGKRLMKDELATAETDFTSIIDRVTKFDADLYSDAIKAGGENYAKLCVLAYRQSIAAHILVKDPAGELLFLSKENSSGGFTATVDVSYPAFPMYLVYNPKLVEGMLNGIFHFVEKTTAWRDPFAPHDIGNYPKANGVTYPFPMPIEESANMILMVAAMEKSLGNVDYARAHWATLTKWVNYLNGIGYDPPGQLTSDDFAGVMAHNINLSAKSINAIAAYAGMARAMGDEATFQKYYNSAKNMAANWLTKGNAGDHMKVAFDQTNDSWSLKYNLIWDKLLGLQLFPKSVYDNEAKFYIKKQNKYGVPLEYRVNTTKNDWVLWAATLATNDADFKALVDPIYKYSQETLSRQPMTDFHNTLNGYKETFHARSVLGAYYIKMLERFWKLNSTCQAPVALVTDNIGTTQASLHWQPGSSAKSLRIQGRAAGSTNWQTYYAPATLTGYTIGGLTPGTTYQWRIAAVCQSTPLTLSDYSDIQTFTTKAAGLGLALSPNPSASTAHLQVSNATGKLTVRLLNLTGQTLWQQSHADSKTAIDIPVSSLREGVYVVTATDGSKEGSVKLLKGN